MRSLQKEKHKRSLVRFLAIAGALALVASGIGISTLVTAEPASATPQSGVSATCEVLSVNLSGFQDIVPAQDAQFGTEYQRYSWVGNPDEIDPATSSPAVHPGSWQANNKGNPGGDPIGEPFQQGSGVNASWFYWAALVVETSPATPEKANTVVVTINGVQVESTTFGTSFAKDYSFADSTVANDWSVTATAWDNPGSPQVWSGTTTPCTTPPVDSCPSDFASPAMWEISWGTSFDNRNGAPTFTTASNGGLTSLNGNPVPSYMTDYDANNPGQNWHWLYISKPATNGGFTYGFADGTVRTVTITADSNGCPSVVWGETPPSAPTAEASASFVQGTCDAVGVLTLTGENVTFTIVNDMVTAAGPAGTVITGVPAGTYPALFNGGEPQSDTNGPVYGTTHITAVPNPGYDPPAVTEWTFTAVEPDCTTPPPVVLPNTISTSHTATCGVGKITLDSFNPWLYRVLIEEEVAPGVWQRVAADPNAASNPVMYPTPGVLVVDNRTGTSVNGPQKRTIGTYTVLFAEDSGTHNLRYKVSSGTERDLYVGLPIGEYTYFTVESDCLPPVVVQTSAVAFTGHTCDVVGTVEAPAIDGARYEATLNGTVVGFVDNFPAGKFYATDDGTESGEPFYGDITIKAVAVDAGHTLDGQTEWTHKFAKPDCPITPTPPSLASTGSESGPILLGALGLISIGAFLALANRLRNRRVIE